MALTLLVLVLCTARLTRIVTTDKITSSWRTKLFLRFPPSTSAKGPSHPLGQLVDCAWCTGYWFAGAVTFVAALIRPDLNGIVWPLIVWQAVAWTSTVAASWLDRG